MSQLNGTIELNHSHLRIHQLTAAMSDGDQQNSDAQEEVNQSWRIIESLKSYCLWAHPFTINDQDEYEDKSDFILTQKRFEALDYFEKDFQSANQLISGEINYLEKLLQSLIEEFKAQINSIISIQDMESKELQREELDQLKQRQFSIISFLRTCIKGVQLSHEDFQTGKLTQLTIDRCCNCQRIIRISEYDEVKRKNETVELAAAEKKKQQYYLKKKKADEKRLRPEQFLQQQEDITQKILKIVKDNKQSQEQLKLEQIHQSERRKSLAKLQLNNTIDGVIRNVQENNNLIIIDDQITNQMKLEDNKQTVYHYLKKQKGDGKGKPLRDKSIQQQEIDQNNAFMMKGTANPFQQELLTINPVKKTKKIEHQNEMPYFQQIINDLNIDQKDEGIIYKSKVGYNSQLKNKIQRTIFLDQQTYNQDKDISYEEQIPQNINQDTINNEEEAKFEQTKDDQVLKQQQDPSKSKKELETQNEEQKQESQEEYIESKKPQKPINLPEIKVNHKVTIIEQQQKNQSLCERKSISSLKDQRQNTGNAQSKIPYQNQREMSYNHKTQQNFGNNKEASAQNKSTQGNSHSYESSKTTINTENIQNETKQRYSHSRDGYQPSMQSKINQNIINNNNSKYTNIKEEKAKVSKLLEEFEKKQKLEKHLKMQEQLDSDMILKSNHQTGAGRSSILEMQQKQKFYECQTPEQQQYVNSLLQIKPWLGCLPLKASKLEYLKKNYPIDDATSMSIFHLEGKDKEDYQTEIEFVETEVVSKRNMLREKKTDFELLMDARYFNKYGDYLHKRLQQKNFYQRLEISKDAQKSEIKKQFYKLALIWHPDNIKKKHKFGFAFEQVFTKLVAEIFVLFEEAYKTLSNEDTRKNYDSKN
ncbi:UNKNOWN [Stylonychia lemnae]|uniref:J domain-containing protein n=1 Tax=Stylonychia lemnae TaxID=5949 RepID=A0A078AR35_STYLE|nr:UNKNOWN [Stylonychia lemnae]|eukprot:CDW84426.1 UNKNOWN [Stylonychia lemnae]